MKVSAESYGHAVILNLKGEVSEDDITMLNQAVEHQLAGPEVVDIVLNLEGVPFMDSAALEYVLDLHERLAERFGQVKLARVGETMMSILLMTRLRSSFEIYEDIPEAVKAMQM
ncbi:MAG TPA: STAS domain-containing protein [Phycisphaerae bacterium]|nr:STAS domain-containing protein [Phycisphaerae bacterium]